MDAGRPLCLLPVTLLGRFQHHCLVTMDGPGAAGVAGLAGKRVGVRSWSQTTGVWVRGIMSDDHGLDVSQVEWVVYEGARWYAHWRDPAQPHGGRDRQFRGGQPGPGPRAVRRARGSSSRHAPHQLLA
jgi:hypothetical protein